MNEDDQKRTNIEDIPRSEEEVSPEEAKNVQGGFDSRTGSGILKSTDGGRTWTSNTVGGSLGSNTVGGSLADDVSNPVKP